MTKPINKGIYLDSPFFVFLRRHFCFSCAHKLDVKKVKKKINEDSSEAKDYHLYTGGSYLFGSAEFYCYMFYCINCDIYYSIDEVKQREKKHEKERRKKSSNND